MMFLKMYFILVHPCVKIHSVGASLSPSTLPVSWSPDMLAVRLGCLGNQATEQPRPCVCWEPGCLAKKISS